MTLAEVAEALDKPFEQVLIEDLPPGSASGAYFVMDQELQDRLLLDPHVMVCSDGSPGMRHPRGYGTFARILRDHVRERHLMTLEEAVHKMSGLPSQTLGMSDRGLIAPGQAADLLIFDPAEVRDMATFEEPHLLAEGIDEVIVNGVPVRRGGEFTGERSGRMLRRADPMD
jgi:N-acyl-D-amino-acid deacylase